MSGKEKKKKEIIWPCSLLSRSAEVFLWKINYTEMIEQFQINSSQELIREEEFKVI